MAGSETLLRLADVHAGYGDDLLILRGVDLALDTGTLTAIIGANGAGKSTLLKTIFGLTRLTRGSLEYRGDAITRWSPERRLKAGIALVPQGRCNFPEMTVRENLEMAAYVRRDDGIARDMERAAEVFPVLADMARRQAGNLSGGEQQMLEMGMALMQRPRLVLLDEPSLGLSPSMQGVVFEAIDRLRVTGTAVLMVEQNAVRALQVADRGVVLELGRVGAEGSGVEMLDDPHVRRSYLGMSA